MSEYTQKFPDAVTSRLVVPHVTDLSLANQRIAALEAELAALKGKATEGDRGLANRIVRKTSSFECSCQQEDMQKRPADLVDRQNRYEKLKSDAATDIAAHRQRHVASVQGKLDEAVRLLREIAEHPHCNYDHVTNGPTPYGTGCADGHRCAAQVARTFFASRTQSEEREDG